MRTISVGELRQNPTAAIDAVAAGETFVVTRHRREVGRLVPPATRKPVTPEDFARAIAATPLEDDWAAEVAAARSDFDTQRDPWERQ